MTILLVNDNPVVSRLLALCTRDDDMVLEEVKGVHTIQNDSYDVVFIDEESYVGEVLNLSDIIHIGKKILLSTVDVEINDFDMTIQKPFLPSQIIEILKSVEVSQENKKMLDAERFSVFPSESEEETSALKKQVLDEDELEKIKALLEMDDDVEIADALSEEELEIRKVEAIKEQLIAEGLEIVGEEEIVDELSASDEVLIFSAEDNREKTPKKNKKKKSAKNKKSKKKHKKKKSLDFTEEELEHIEDAVQVAIATLKRKQMKKLLKGKKIEISIALEDTH